MEAKYARSSGVNRWLLVSVVVLIAGMTGAATACGGKEAATTSGTSTSTTAGPTPTATATPAINVVHDVRYMTQRTGWIPATLDVYAPKQGGPWPVVVMLHGGGLRKYWLTAWAVKVAQRGAVVFVPDWGLTVSQQSFSPATISPKELRVASIEGHGDLAAVVRFARGTAARYGGDSANLTLFGHSAGANEASMEAFSGVSASKGGFDGAGSTIPESLVLFDPDLLLAGDPLWDAYLAADPSILQVLTPWQYVNRRVDFPVTLIGSADPALTRQARDPWAKGSWLAVRDPSGNLRRGLEKVGAFSGGRFINDGALKLLLERLQAAGDTATYVQLTGSTHTSLSEEGMQSLLDALVPNTQP
jgi:Carboxylesterase family